MEEMIPCSLKNQEVFQRVWQRVMAGREEGVSRSEEHTSELQSQR